MLSALAGLVFGLAAATRPTVLLFMPVLALWMLWTFRRRGSWSGALVPVSLLTIGTVLPIAPLTAHNISTGDTSLVSTQGGVNFWIGNNPESDGHTAIVPGTRSNWWGGYQDSITQAEANEGRALTPGEVSSHYAGRAFEYIRSDFGGWLGLMGTKLRIFWSNHEFGNNQPIAFYAKRFNPWSSYLPVRYADLLALALLGLVLSWRHGARIVPAAGFVLVYSLGVIAFFVCARFRMPILPVLMVFASHGIVWLVEQVRASR